jgi:hypothetical protein
MDKDRVEGKIKDVAGRVERQVGEWTGDPEKQGAKCRMRGARRKTQPSLPPRRIAHLATSTTRTRTKKSES